MHRIDNYSNTVYGIAGITAFFASLSLYEWGFLIGMAFSMALGVVTYSMNRREQVKRTKAFQEFLNRIDPNNPSASAHIIAEVMAKAPKDV